MKRSGIVVALQRLVGCWFGQHDWTWSHNWHGDQIIMAGWNRSAWHCRKCGKWQDRAELHNPNTARHGRAVARPVDALVGHSDLEKT